MEEPILRTKPSFAVYSVWVSITILFVVMIYSCLIHGNIVLCLFIVVGGIVLATINLNNSCSYEVYIDRISLMTILGNERATVYLSDIRSWSERRIYRKIGNSNALSIIVEDEKIEIDSFVIGDEHYDIIKKMLKATMPEQEPEEPRVNVKKAKAIIAGLIILSLYALYIKIEHYYYGIPDGNGFFYNSPIAWLMIFIGLIIYYSVKIAYEKERDEDENS